jgi:archaellum component FlaC
MFNKKEEPRANTYELQVENEKLRIKRETLEFKLEQMNEKCSVLEEQLRKAKSTDVEKIKSENESLRKRNWRLEL